MSPWLDNGPLLIAVPRDTISSHEKKRHYLECVEQYVMYLHQQLQLVGSEPVKLERVSNYRGLSSRSIRVSSLYPFRRPARLYRALGSYCLDSTGAHGELQQKAQPPNAERGTAGKSSFIKCPSVC